MVPTGVVEGRGNILLLTDQTGRRLGVSLMAHLANNSKLFNTTHILKPGASLDNVVKDVSTVSKNFTNKDYVIVMGGRNDFSNPKLSLIRLLIDSCSHTNLILLSTPFSPQGHYAIDKLIYDFHFKVKNMVEKFCWFSQNVLSFIDTNVDHFTKKINNEKISLEIKNVINSNDPRIRHNNLVFVNCSYKHCCIVVLSLCINL